MENNKVIVSDTITTKTGKFKDILRTVKRQKFILLLLLPGVIWYLVFCYVPLYGIKYAFTDMGLTAKPSFVGFDNFRRLFLSPNFHVAFRNTLIISFYNLIFYFPMPIILALCINELRSLRLKRLFQFVVYIPHFFSWVVVGGIFTLLLSPTTGVVNEIVKMFGHEPIFFMADPKWFRSVLVSSQVWKDVGYGTVIYIAALASIDEQLYDAAAVDGAGHLGKLWHITLPGLKSTIAVVLLLTVARILNVFEQVFVMFNSAVYEVSDVIRTYAYTVGLVNGDLGYATAIGLFTSIVSAILIIGCNKLSKVLMDESIL